jgi:GntR family transcriptional regulator of abcA and norABC
MNSWRPDRESHIPLYLQIEQHINLEIKRYVRLPIRTPAVHTSSLLLYLLYIWLVQVTKIPSQRKLAEELQVNRSTVTAAVDELIAQGLLEGKNQIRTRLVLINGLNQG